MTPSFPTLSAASAVSLPYGFRRVSGMSTYLSNRFGVGHGTDRAFSSSTAAATALSIPRFRSIGLYAATAFRPSVMMDCASLVAVVRRVRSAQGRLLSASLRAHVFQTCLRSSISRATRTPPSSSDSRRTEDLSEPRYGLSDRGYFHCICQYVYAAQHFHTTSLPNFTSLAAIFLFRAKFVCSVSFADYASTIARMSLSDMINTSSLSIFSDFTP